MKQVKGYQWMDIAGCQAGAFNYGYHSLHPAVHRLVAPQRDVLRGAATGVSRSGPASLWDRAFNQGLADVARPAG